jgi:3D (Asp-Asp-Asp) domain-containing protein
MHITVYYTTLDKWYAGRHYITAYCPWECGYNGENYPAGWRTSSGEICHYSDDPLVPTTCAIDRRYHAYGEYLMIDGKLYVTEDTGPGVQGLWVDIFVESMDEVQSFGSHYTDVYYVDFIEHSYSERYMHRLFVPSHTMVREINSLYNED